MGEVAQRCSQPPSSPSDETPESIVIVNRDTTELLPDFPGASIESLPSRQSDLLFRSGDAASRRCMLKKTGGAAPSEADTLMPQRGYGGA